MTKGQISTFRKTGTFIIRLATKQLKKWYNMNVKGEHIYDSASIRFQSLTITHMGL